MDKPADPETPFTEVYQSFLDDLAVEGIKPSTIHHTALGFFLVTSWRRTGNLAAPGIAHAVTDALRNAVAVL